MIVTSSQQKVNLEERLQSNTVDQMFLTSVEQGANCPPFVARAILSVAKSTFNVGNCTEHEAKKTRPDEGIRDLCLRACRQTIEGMHPSWCGPDP